MRTALVEFWTPKDTLLDRVRTDRVPYDAWERAGYLHAPSGVAVNYGAVAVRLGELAARFAIQGVAFDAYRIKYFLPELESLGISVPLFAHGQGYTVAKDSGLWMPRSIELTETLLAEQRIVIQANPVLRWNAASVIPGWPE